MKKKIVLFTAIAGMGYLIFSSHAAGPAKAGYDCTGAEAGGTGSYANPTGCSAGSGCHSTSATSSITATLELDSAGIATTHYKGGTTYTIKLTGNNASGNTLPRYGFQITCMKGTTTAATVSSAGTFATTGLPASTHIVPPGTYTQLTVAEHDAPIAQTGTSFTETFTWTAPVSGTGNISFWGAANFVNFNGSADPGDIWNTTSIDISEWPTVNAVAIVNNNSKIKAFPNPVTNILNLQLTDAQAGTYNVQAFDITGNCASNENIEINGINQVANLNTSNWAPGVYQVIVTKEGKSMTTSIVKNAQ